MRECARFRLSLLGPVSLADAAGRRVDIRSKKGAALLALTAMAPNGERSRTWLQELLWGTRNPQQAQGSLRRELSNLTKLLRAHDADAIIGVERHRVYLRLDLVSVDARELAEGTPLTGPMIPGTFAEGLDLADCDLFEDWLREQRARCDNLLRFAPTAQPPLTDARAVLGEPLPPTVDILSRAPRRPPPKPSIAILPFLQQSGTDRDRALAIGIAEEIELALSRFRTLFIVASTSARVLAERNMTQVEIGAALGVRYLVGGSLRRDGETIRLAVALLDAADGHRIWSGAYVLDDDSAQGVEERIAGEIAPRVHTQVDLSELETGLKIAAPKGDARGLYWRINALARQWERNALLEAIELCDDLLALQPTNAWALSLASFCFALGYTSYWLPDLPGARRRAMELCEQSLRYGGDDPTVIGFAACTYLLARDDALVADRLINSALARLPAHQPTLFWGGWVDIVMGNAVRARERFELGLRVNPEAAVRPYMITGIGMALLMQGDFRQAYDMLADSVIHIPTYPMTLAGLTLTAMLTGREDVARDAAARLNALGGIDQVLGLFRNPEHRAMLANGVRLAGGEAA